MAASIIILIIIRILVKKLTSRSAFYFSKSILS